MCELFFHDRNSCIVVTVILCRCEFYCNCPHNQRWITERAQKALVMTIFYQDMIKTQQKTFENGQRETSDLKNTHWKTKWQKRHIHEVMQNKPHKQP